MGWIQVNGGLMYICPHSYLDEIERITAKKYIPTDGWSLCMLLPFNKV